MTELNKKFELVAGLSDLGIGEFVTKSKSQAQAEIDNATLVPAITNATTTKTLIVGIETKEDNRIALILEAKQLTKDIKADRKKVTKIITDDWPPLIKAAIGEDTGKANLLGYGVKWVDGGHTIDEPSIKNSVPLIKPIGNYTHLEQEINVINSKSNKVAVPWDVKHTNLYQFFGADAPTNVKQCSYLGILKRGKFINHFDAEELDQDVWYLAEYIPKDDGIPPKLSEAVKSHVI
ncbi:MAG: hypothetical protein WCQ41_09770 [Bacillota bacterium]